MSDFAFSSISIRLYALFSVTFSSSLNQIFTLKTCTQYLQPICVVCNFLNRSLRVLASKLPFISQKLWHTILKMIRSGKFYRKSSEILSPLVRNPASVLYAIFLHIMALP
jgi:hypothetical protein